MELTPSLKLIKVKTLDSGIANQISVIWEISLEIRIVSKTCL